MSKWQGKKISVEIYGESHGEKIGIICKNFPKFKFNKDSLSKFLARRQGGNGYGTTPRKEGDEPIFTGEVESGNFEAYILNENKKSQDYSYLYGKPRPSHADYCTYVKDGVLDFSGGGRFSGRLTAPYCVAGGIVKEFLLGKGIRIYAYLQSVGKVEGKSYKEGVSEEELKGISGFPSIDKSQEMIFEIESARADGDSVGAICECVVYGLKAGFGNDYFEGLESSISSLVYAIPAVKGVEFGSGFDIAKMRGSEANDGLQYDSGNVVTKTNNAGGINGGISNGMPITFRVAFRPTPSISKVQNTVDLVNKCNTEISVKGRHDACVAVRALPVIESAVSLAIYDSGEFYDD